MPAFVYMLRCADGSYYVGSSRGESLDKRLSEHQTGTYAGYTSQRRPVTLVWSERFERFDEAIAYERRLKGWSRAKKEVLIRGDWDGLQEAAKRQGKPHFSDPPPSS
ncbi:excinuclease ABC subunit C [Methylobacterium sp. Leaf456]|uniref:GIY-YIG nuclease family protein n=1 Tax=Methylobacterium sp. Leaf456 TaxID=1736382 RepID=UPI0006F2D9BC|nr:GIY-YIG nuclease family protein [Methylobacterium sp. Leaf456]KQT47871.1 excinuclease ABC subunit C [Methylobacterium sp. Leaf456]